MSKLSSLDGKATPLITTPSIGGLAGIREEIPGKPWRDTPELFTRSPVLAMHPGPFTSAWNIRESPHHPKSWFASPAHPLPVCMNRSDTQKIISLATSFSAVHGFIKSFLLGIKFFMLDFHLMVNSLQNLVKFISMLCEFNRVCTDNQQMGFFHFSDVHTQGLSKVFWLACWTFPSPKCTP